MITYILFKHRAWSCQKHAGRASQMLTYILFETQRMLLSATSRKGHPDTDLHPVWSPEHALVSKKQEGPARCWFTFCIKHRVLSCWLQAGKAWQVLTYTLFKTHSMLLSAPSRKGEQDADLQTNQNQGHALVSNKQGKLARCWLTSCSKPRTCSCQKKAGTASQMPTYNLFKTQSMLLSATSRKGQPDADLQPVQNPEHACPCQRWEGGAGQMLTYKLCKTQNMRSSAISREGQPDANLHPVQNPEHIFVSNKQERPARC